MPKRHFQLNPAFAAAHGIAAPAAAATTNDAARASTDNTPDTGDGKGNNHMATRPTDDPPAVIHSTFSQKRFDQALQRARQTGKLNLANMGLSAPLPAVDLRAKVEYSMTSNTLSSSHHQSFAEENVSLLDLSDNDLDVAADADAKAETPAFELDQFPLLQILRLRRCNLKEIATSTNANGTARIPISFPTTFEHLAILDLSQNQLTTINLGSCAQTLQELNLSNNKLQAITATNNESTNEAPTAFPNLRVLDASNNQITSLEAMHCPNLQHLDVAHNQFTSLPSITHLQCDHSLKSFNASHNQIADASQLQTKVLEVLNLSYNRLTTAVPPLLPSIVRYDVSNNKLTDLSGILSQPSAATSTALKCQELYLHDNYLTQLDGAIFIRLQTSLQRLNLASNQFKTTLPNQIGLCTNLQHCNIHNNPLWRIPNSQNLSLRALMELFRKRMKAEGQGSANPSSSAPTSAATNAPATKGSAPKSASLLASVLDDRGIMNFGRWSTHAPLSPQDLEAIGDEVAQRQEDHADSDCVLVEAIILDGKAKGNIVGLGTLPDSLFAANTVSKIEINHIQLQQFPSLALSFPHLTHLDLSNNRLTSFELPAQGDGGMPKLQSINLSGNRLRHFPKLHNRCVSLRHLNVSHNQIASLDDAARFTQSFEYFDISHNYVKSISETWILRLCASSPQLRTLQFQANDIRQIPFVLGMLTTHCSKSVAVHLQQNPQRMVRQEKVDNLAYLQTKLSHAQAAAYGRQIEAMKEALAGQATAANSASDDAPAIAAEPAPIAKEKDEKKLPPTEAKATLAEPATEPVVAKEMAAVAAPAPAETTTTTSAPAPTETETETEIATTAAGDLMNEERTKLKASVVALEEQLESFSLSQAKRYAVKKSLAMERSKLIRLERQAKK